MSKHLLDTLSELTPFYVWSYNGAVQIVNFPENAYMQIAARGICPHCAMPSYFRPVGSALQMGVRAINACQCEACKEFLLVIGMRTNTGTGAALVAVYPLGKPNDTVAPEVVQANKGVAEDFSEALRCQWIKAHKACVVMCRRAVQASALALGAPKGKKLDQQIDALFAAGKITGPLKDFAHEVRLTGNKGAHPDKDAAASTTTSPDAADRAEDDDNLQDVSEKDADDIVEFTREYLHHIYVMPAKLKARKKAT